MSTEAIPQHIYSTSVHCEDDGTWLNAIDGDGISPGMHRVMVEDGNGNSDEALLYVSQGDAQFLDRVTNVMPPAFNYAILALFSLVVCLVAVELWLGYHADKTRGKRWRNPGRFIVIALIVALSSMTVTYAIWKKANLDEIYLFDGMRKNVDLPSEKVDVTGTLRSPLTYQAVEGVDLTAGDTSIKTSSGGKFAFNSVDKHEGLRLNHPKLKASFYKTLPQSGSMDLIFDVDLYNTVFGIAQLESRGRLSDVYQGLDEAIKAKTSKDTFIEKYQRLFFSENTLDQAIVIADIREQKDWVSDNGENSYPQVIQVTVENYPQAKDYLFVPTSAGWRLVI